MTAGQLRRRPAQVRRTEVRRRGPRGRGEPPAHPQPVAGQPARLERQGQRVLPQAPARHRQRRHRRAGPARQAPRGHRLARRRARGQARPADDDRLPDDQLDAVLRRRAAGGHLVREARHQHHRHAPVRALVQPGDLPALAVQDRLGGLEGDREEVLRARRRPPRHPPRRRRQAAVARHPRGHGHRARRRQGLAQGRVRAGAGQDHAGARRRRARLHQGLREDDLDRPAAGVGGHAHQGRALRREPRGRDPPPPQRGGARTAPAPASPSWRPTSTSPTRSCTCRAPRTGTSPPTASATSRSAPAPSWPTSRPSTRASRSPSPTPRSRRSRHHLTGVVGLGVGRAPLRAVHDQHRAAQALPHPHRAPAVLPRPRLDPRAWGRRCRSTGRR